MTEDGEKSQVVGWRGWIVLQSRGHRWHEKMVHRRMDVGSVGGGDDTGRQLWSLPMQLHSYVATQAWIRNHCVELIGRRAGE
jgi:hypothetical protein